MPNHKRPPDWHLFAQRLTATLQSLEDDQYLVLASRHQHRFVQFAGAGADGIRAECVSNHYLPAGDRLGATEHRALRRLGWQAPDRRPVGSKSVGRAGGSPNWFRPFPCPLDAAAAADLAVRTFTEVYGETDLASLQYHAFEQDGRMVSFPGLGLQREGDRLTAASAFDAPAPRAVAERLAEALRYACDDQGVTRHSRRQWTLTVEGTALAVVLDEPPLLARIIAPLFPAASLEGDLFETLNEMNAEQIGYGHVYLREGEVRYAAELPVEPFDPGVFVVALQMAAGVVRDFWSSAEIDVVGIVELSDDERPDVRRN